MPRTIVTIALVLLVTAFVAFNHTQSASVESLKPSVPLLVAPGEVHSVRQFPIVMKDVVFDATTGKFYASVPSRAGALGNSIVKIDPVTGQVESSVIVGSDPGKLALADDGHTLYISLDGAAAVRRYDLTTQTPGQQFSIGESTSNAPVAVKDMSVAPGNPNLLAVSRKSISATSPDFEGVAIYDAGVRRPLTTPGHTGSDYVDFSNSAAVLYGSSEGGAGLQRMSVSGSGVSVVGSVNPGVPGGEFKFENDFLYLPFGQVFNAANFQQAGTFVVGSNLGTSRVEPDATAGRVFFLNGQSAFGDDEIRSLTLRAFDLSNFTLIGSITFPTVKGQVTNLIRWGANGLAFGTTGGQFFIIQTSFIPSPEPVPSPTPTPSPTPSPTATPTPTPGPGQLREVAIRAKDIVIDPSGTIFASVESSASTNPNSITPIDPIANALGQPVTVGTDPNQMAISDNGQVIYVGLNGPKAIRRFDVPTRTPGIQFPVDAQGQNVAVDLAVAPGQSQTVAAARGSNPNASDGGVAVYDDGVQRPVTTGLGHTISVIEYSGAPHMLYGFNRASSESGFRKMAVPSCGPSILSVRPSLFPGAVNFEVENGRAFATIGRVADPETGTLLGTYQVLENLAQTKVSSAVIADSAANRVYFFMNDLGADFNPGTMYIRAYDMQTFLHIGTLALPNISGRTTSAVRWGIDGFAFRTTTDRVYLIQTSLIPGQSQPPTPAPSPTPATYTLRGQISNNSGQPLPPVTVQLTGGQTATTSPNADGTFVFENLPFCTDFTVTPSVVGNFTFSPTSITITPANQNSTNQSTAFFNAVPKTIQFQSTSIGGGEANTAITVTVIRQGDVSLPATVDYQTTDVTASDRSDYGAAVGTLRFEAGQSSKQILIFPIDDVRDEPNETFTVTLSNPTGAFLGTQTTLNVSIVDNDASNGTNNPADDATFFVRQHYRDFLNRNPDTDGLAFWVNEINSCGSDAQCIEVKRINVSAAFFLSIEFQETGYLAYRTFKSAFGDTSSPNVLGPVPIIKFREFIADGRRIGEGVQVGVGNWEAQLEANKNAYALEFVQRQRFIDAFAPTMTADEFVTKLDQNAGGVLSVTQKSQLVALLGQTPGDNTKRAAVLRAVADDSDLRAAEFNRAFVMMQYCGYLRRAPNDAPDTDFTGFDFWLGKLNQFNGNFVNAEMVKAFIVSSEYRLRFGP